MSEFPIKEVVNAGGFVVAVTILCWFMRHLLVVFIPDQQTRHDAALKLVTDHCREEMSAIVTRLERPLMELTDSLHQLADAERYHREHGHA